MNNIPNTMHFIWLGSFIQPKHQDRLKQWRLQNPDYVINLWICKNIISESGYTQLNEFCQTNGFLLIAMILSPAFIPAKEEGELEITLEIQTVSLII